MNTFRLAVTVAAALTAPQLLAVSPNAQEMEERDIWVAAKFEKVLRDAAWNPGIAVLNQHDPIQRNTHAESPLQIKETVFKRGVFCHAPSKIVVQLDSPGKSFSAQAGILVASGRAGSVEFSVTIGDQRVFQSDVRRGGWPALPVKVDLNGARSFTLEISDGGDNIGADQSAWCDAKITLENGEVLWLDELEKIALGPRYDLRPFFSFNYDGKPSSEFLENWKVERSSRDIDAHRTEYTLTYTDPSSQLVVRCEGVAWKNYPTVEWTLYFKNEGDSDSPLIESIQALDTTFSRTPAGEFLLHHHVGDKAHIESFAPRQTTLGPNASLEFAPRGGRPTNFEWPYYALERPLEEKGTIIAIGWPGQWASRFIRDEGTGIRVVGGQELTRLKLHPGEEIRTPLIAMQFFGGDRYRAQNIWRRWMFQHNFPKDHGKPLSVKHGAACVWNYGFQCTQEGDIEFINTFADKGIDLSYWWMDAGWYPGDGNWGKTGTWKPDPTRFPDGIKAVTDAAHSKGFEVVVWFEVERVAADTWITQNHPEWVHGGAGGGLLKLDEPEVAEWVTNHVDKMITEEGIDLFRVDFNIDPLSYWRNNDTEDRQGITEIRYIDGFLGFWDELRRRHPGMLIDSCASGGRRDDLETMRRSVPLLRTDLENNPEAYQCATYGFCPWLPYSNCPNWEKFDTYHFRSSIAPFLQCNWDVRKDDFPLELAQSRIKEWRSVADYYFGDFWPLTDYSTHNRSWMAWQLDYPEKSGGLVQAFRRADCPFVSAQFQLEELDPEARYQVKDYDAEAGIEKTGRELMEKGLIVTIPEKPGAALITYEKISE